MNKEKKKTKMYTNIEAATEFHSIEYQKFDRKCVRVCVWVLEREREIEKSVITIAFHSVLSLVDTVHCLIDILGPLSLFNIDNHHSL